MKAIYISSLVVYKPPLKPFSWRVLKIRILLSKIVTCDPHTCKKKKEEEEDKETENGSLELGFSDLAEDLRKWN